MNIVVSLDTYTSLTVSIFKMDHTKVEVTDKFEIINVDVLVIIVVFGTFMNLQHLNRLEVFTI